MSDYRDQLIAVFETRGEPLGPDSIWVFHCEEDLGGHLASTGLTEDESVTVYQSPRSSLARGAGFLYRLEKKDLLPAWQSTARGE